MREKSALIDRDYNAAVNILNEGLRIIGLSSPEFTPVDCPTMDDRLGNEALKSSGRLKQEKNDIHNFSINVGTIWQRSFKLGLGKSAEKRTSR